MSPDCTCPKTAALTRWVVALLLAAAAGCESGLERLDRHTRELLIGTSTSLGTDAIAPELEMADGPRPTYRKEAIAAYHPPTTNPPADMLPYVAAHEAAGVLERLERYAEVPPHARRLDLQAALAYAVRHSREYRFAEETYIIDALRLLSERHLWGPRLFDDLSATVEGFGDSGLYDTSLRLVNDLEVTQRLPYGGEVSARLLAEVSEDLHKRVAGETVHSADIILSADVPLLRGAGLVAREDLIQAERNLIYGARDFERFRREFLFDITTDFLNLVVQRQAINNTERQVRMLEDFEQRDRALVESGRQEPFQAALAAQSTLFARDRLNSQRESYRLAVDRFKVRIGMPESEPLVIVMSFPGLAPPAIEMDAAVRRALAYRLDLQTARDLLDDARRGVLNARNALLADLDLTGSIIIPTDDARERALFDFDVQDTAFSAGLSLSLPLDRRIERVNLRQSQIDLERARRAYDRFRDDVAVEVRSAVRNIDRARFSLSLQEENVRIAERRLASIEAAPDRASARDRSEAADDLLQAQDDLDRARRDLEIAILEYLLATGQLRVDREGSIRRLRGMDLQEEGSSSPAGDGGAGSSPAGTAGNSPRVDPAEVRPYR